MLRKLDAVVAFLVPIPVFLTPASPFLLAAGTLHDDALAFPLSFFLLPIAVAAGLLSIQKVKGTLLVLVGILSLFFAWCYILAFVSLTTSKLSLVYAFQWSLPLFWGIYFFSRFQAPSVERLGKPLFWGSFSGSLFIFSAGALELVIYGQLLDFGRMTQNLVVKGQYQLYTYTPTVLALSSLIVAALWKARAVHLNPLLYFIYLGVTATAILFTGAREGVLVFVLGTYLILFCSNAKGALSSLLLAIGLGAALVANFEGILEYLASADLRALSKFARLADAGEAFGARDQMIATYVGLYLREPMGGFGVLPPELAHPAAGIDIKSAHNYFIDVLSWTGIPGLLLMIAFVFIVLLAAFWRIAEVLLWGRSHSISTYCAWVVLMSFLVSSNINVPFRQPLIVPVIILAISLMLRRPRAAASHAAL